MDLATGKGSALFITNTFPPVLSSFTSFRATLANLDATYAAGDFQLQHPVGGSTNLAQLNLGGPKYPPIPPLLTLPLQSENALDANVTLQWEQVTV